MLSTPAMLRAYRRSSSLRAPIFPAPPRPSTLAARGVLVLPRLIANAGGVICAAVEYRGGTETAALALIDEKIRSNTEAMLDEVRAPTPYRAPRHYRSLPSGCAGRCGHGDGRAQWHELLWINVPAWRSPENGVRVK